MKWICIIFIVFFSCREELNIEIKAEVEKIDIIVASVGFSTKGARGYYKQKLHVKYSYKDSLYRTSFVGDKSLGKFNIGDSVVIIFGDNPMDFEAKKRIPKYKRKKFKAVKGTAK